MSILPLLLNGLLLLLGSSVHLQVHPAHVNASTEPSRHALSQRGSARTCKGLEELPHHVVAAPAAVAQVAAQPIRGAGGDEQAGQGQAAVQHPAVRSSRQHSTANHNTAQHSVRLAGTGLNQQLIGTCCRHHTRIPRLVA